MQTQLNTNMAKADLHLHSKYSDYPSTWAHKLYNSPESYTEIETIYQQAKSRGMDFVTITDHDDIRGAIELVASHPNDCFISCEVTSYFPEDNAKLHVLVYGIEEFHYHDIMEIRRDIYTPADYLKQHKIAHSLAHAAYDQDGKLKIEHIEKCLLLFQNFETINGGSSQEGNELISQYLTTINSEKIAYLSQKHALKPLYENSAVKGLTGGSDDHCGLLIGSAYTKAAAQNKEEFLEALRNKNTSSTGLHGSFESYAIGVFKHIHDYQSHNSDKYKKTKTFVIFEQLFNGYRGNWLARLKSSRSLKYLKHKNGETHQSLFKLIDDISKKTDVGIEDKIPMLYENCTYLHDSLGKAVIKAMTKDLEKGNLFSLFTDLSRIFPAIALGAPFLGSLRHQVIPRQLKNDLLSHSLKPVTQKALWFTDTIDDLNGVSVSLKQISKYADKLGYQLKLVTAHTDTHKKFPDNIINLRAIDDYTLPFYQDITLNFPSLLESIKRIAEEQADEIIISTPGPVGLLALLCGKILDIPVKGVYHTDFGAQISHILGDDQLGQIVDSSITMFYRQLDEVYVPSDAYIDKLAVSGLSKEKLSIFPRGFDEDVYQELDRNKQLKMIPELQTLAANATIMTAGRVSLDKNINLVCDTYDELIRRGEDLNLIIVGDGPSLDNLRKRYEGVNNVLLCGRVEAHLMPAIYSFADVQLFPSRTDTFGMVVLEAQACGLPTLVSNSGGPQEIIRHGTTGEVISNDCANDWANVTSNYLLIKRDEPEQFSQLRKTCQRHIQAKYSWKTVLHELFGERFLLNNDTIVQRSTLDTAV